MNIDLLFKIAGIRNISSCIKSSINKSRKRRSSNDDNSYWPYYSTYDSYK